MRDAASKTDEGSQKQMVARTGADPALGEVGQDVRGRQRVVAGLKGVGKRVGGFSSGHHSCASGRSS